MTLKVGKKMADGTIYAGISPDTGKQMFVQPLDTPLTYSFNMGPVYAEALNKQKAHGHDDWRPPSKAELNELFKNHAAIGGFNLSGSGPEGWYISSTPDDNGSRAWAQRFSDGYQTDGIDRSDSCSLRCVR